MAVAVADRERVGYILESTWGTTPNTAAQLVRLRGESLKRNQVTVDSQEIRADRATSDTIITEISASGGLEIELSHTTYDDFLRAALFADSAFSATEEHISGETTISFESITTSSSSYAKIKDSANGMANYNQYEWVRVAGAGTSGNNQIGKIQSVAAGELEIYGIDFTDESAGSSVTLTQLGSVTNGVTQIPMSIFKEFTNLSGNKFVEYLGMVCNTAGLAITPGSPLTGSFDFLGKIATARATSIGNGTQTAAPTKKIFSTVTHVTLIQGAASASAATNFTWDVNNNLRARQVIGAGTGAHSIAEGKFGLTGNFTTLYEDDSVFALWEADTATNLAAILNDGAGNIYVIDLPHVQFTDADRVGGGENTDVVANMTYRAHLSPTENVVCRLARIAA